MSDSETVPDLEDSDSENSTVATATARAHVTRRTKQVKITDFLQASPLKDRKLRGSLESVESRTSPRMSLDSSIMYNPAFEKVYREMTPLEQNYPKITSAKAKFWPENLNKYSDYVNQGGKRSLYETMTHDCKLQYKLVLENVDIKSISTRQLIKLIDKYHNPKAKDGQSILTTLKMKPNKEYDPQNVENYILYLAKFLEKYDKDLDNVSEVQLSKQFISGLQPKWLSAWAWKSEPKTINQVVQTIRDRMIRMEEFYEIMSWIQ